MRELLFYLLVSHFNSLYIIIYHGILEFYNFIIIIVNTIHEHLTILLIYLTIINLIQSGTPFEFKYRLMKFLRYSL